MLLLTGLGAASAKEAITRLRLCGASDCVTVRDMTTLQILMTYIGASPGRRPSLAPYFTFAPIPTRQWPSSYPRYLYVPSVKVVRVQNPPTRPTWESVGGAAQLLQHLTAHMRPYTTPGGWDSVRITAQATSQPLLPPPGLRSSAAWLKVTTGPSGFELAPQVWAITARTDLRALQPFNLFDGLRHLERNGIVLWATTAGHGGPTTVFSPDRLPLRLSHFRIDHHWEGQPRANVQQRLRWVSVGGWRLDVRVYFGTQTPDRRLLSTAQTEINRLQLP
jgi:hypothetical protein